MPRTTVYRIVYSSNKTWIWLQYYLLWEGSEFVKIPFLLIKSSCRMFRSHLISAVLSSISYLTTFVWCPLANKAKPWVSEAWRLCSPNSKEEPFFGFTLNLMLSRLERRTSYFRMSTGVWYFQRKGSVGQLVSYSELPQDLRKNEWQPQALISKLLYASQLLYFLDGAYEYI